MRILVIYQHYLAAGEPGGLRYNEFARMWSEAGHQVTVIAGTVNYATGEQRPEYRGKFVSRDADGPVQVLRAHVPSAYHKGTLGRMWAFAGFTLSASAATFLAEPPDVVIASSPPLVASIPGWVASRFRRPGGRVPLIVEIRDLWPESAITTGVLRKESSLAKFLYRLEAWSYRAASKITVLTPAFRDDLLKRGLVNDEKVWFVPNGADIDLYRPAERHNRFRAKQAWGDRFVALYAGAHGRANALHQLIDAAMALRHRPDILIACVGDGPFRAELEQATRQKQLANLQFLGPFSKSEMPLIISACDAGLAVLQNNPTFRTVYPNKVFDYMSCARPVVLAIDGVIRDLICDQAQAGLFAMPEDGTAIAQALIQLADDPGGTARLGQNGRHWVERHASREALANVYLSALLNLLEQTDAARQEPQHRLAS
jgi:glycosyltransferase involved in cell wall biosynthesis